MFKQSTQHCFFASQLLQRRRKRGAEPPPPKKKNREKYFSRNHQVQFGYFPVKYHVQFGNFVNFSGKYHVKFGHFVIFFIHNFRAKCLDPKVDWAPMPMNFSIREPTNEMLKTVPPEFKEKKCEFKKKTLNPIRMSPLKVVRNSRVCRWRWKLLWTDISCKRQRMQRPVERLKPEK